MIKTGHFLTFVIRKYYENIKVGNCLFVELAKGVYCEAAVNCLSIKNVFHDFHFEIMHYFLFFNRK